MVPSWWPEGGGARWRMQQPGRCEFARVEGV